MHGKVTDALQWLANHGIVHSTCQSWLIRIWIILTYIIWVKQLCYTSRIYDSAMPFGIIILLYRDTDHPFKKTSHPPWLHQSFYIYISEVRENQLVSKEFMHFNTYHKKGNILICTHPILHDCWDKSAWCRLACMALFSENSQSSTLSADTV